MMKKWKCMNRECGENCIVESKKFHPANCPMFTENFHLQADWREVTEPVTEGNQLPKLPDWCKVGEWVWNKDRKDYAKIGKSDNGWSLNFNGTWLNNCSDDYMADMCVPARLRPYNAEEMKALVGKVVEFNKTGDLCFVAGYCNLTKRIYVGQNNFNADLLLSNFTVDGKPCGVLEHMEDGEWVK